MTGEGTLSNGQPAKNSTLPWVEKYRPTTLDDVVAHEEILDTTRRLMNSGSMPHLLFYGPPGTGKTTTIKACAHHLFGKERLRANVLEMNASDDRGIDVVRQQVREFASTSSIFFQNNPGNQTVTNFKLVILDEADQMSSDAQAALRRIIEKFTKNVRFCILCNHINKIIPALQSRCTRFRFSPVKKSAMLPRLKLIAREEGVPFTDEGLISAFRLSDGDMRRCLNTMQASSMSAGEITEESVYRTTGNPTPTDVRVMVGDMLSHNYATSWEKVQQLVVDKGVSTADLVREVHLIVMAMDLPQDCKCFLLIKLADVEYYAAGGTREMINIGGVLGAFQLVKEALTQNKPIFELAGGLC
ncbi:replication factor C, subunit 3, putative [Trypanosoma equiperdum]|uniref:Replication factor C, subunit 3, putative n=4 Tax=Trypanozoon TaxID=39700 RepID=Q38DH5_TRYB2|nr:replication factor C, subunit 3, putative [Trypanosoma brucei gambiense DAL972]XP_827475.1 replication factor C subunit 3 [Trypanosoma brucei brucei TREU927]RHW69971.1 replication factor C [Trypanosoma brucei equiperdum]SCU71736.1 replication factor C, subunit 3, putative [Trypanosoma equiperdum]EAN77145.1 replication factor C, subunit 3, putative [Trypanosoma brucei brucei TREU927]CBH14672.1 replication factor C, subunit 3, putative [Trypanosoma brucei gambiense DAL972]|eukprot:XP_011776938.1 replication factor C, subunit 3, putative [Trypanosoma brucei gambiense DAL972]